MLQEFIAGSLELLLMLRHALVQPARLVEHGFDLLVEGLHSLYDLSQLIVQRIKLLKQYRNLCLLLLQSLIELF